MENDLIKYAERKMSLFNLVISLWQHNLVLMDTIGIGFKKSVFIYKDQTCGLYATKKEIVKITDRVLELIKTNKSLFTAWYLKAKVLNKQADKLLAFYQNEKVSLDANSYRETLQIFINNFGFC